MEIEKAKEFYKGHESAPLPRIDGVIEIEENELFDLLTEFAKQRLDNEKALREAVTHLMRELGSKCHDNEITVKNGHKFISEWKKKINLLNQ